MKSMNDFRMLPDGIVARAGEPADDADHANAETDDPAVYA
jgi:hypothetical protein